MGDIENKNRLGCARVPTNYKLTIHPNLQTLAFTGSVEVKTRILVESKQVVLNSADLAIFRVAWTWEGGDNDGEVVKPVAVKMDTENERVNILFNPPLGIGSGKLKMDFIGVLNDKLKGFYRSKYTTPSGEERFSAVTQFAPTDARRCFPCWDEPAIKSTFDLTLIAPKNRVAISNTPVKSIEAYAGDENLQAITFETTPIMSTYLLAFVIGEFDFVEGLTSDGIKCRVYTPLGKKENGQFALDVTTRVIPYYSEYFQIPYPLNKIDLIAVPDCFYGAMENWGLLIYRETALLVDPTESSASSRQYVALVVGHEIAHQWFGNLVTMEWWTHLWLNEGYASFVEFMCVENLFPDYDIWTQFVTDTQTPALELDCLDSSHPIEVDVNHPSQIDEIFDAISYRKGASIIRMLHHFLADDSFRRGMNLYLTRHKHRNATTQDLWQALGEASKLNVAEIMGSWTRQMGYPLISLQEIAQDDTGSVFKLSQHKFCLSPASRLSFDAANWQVPLSFSNRSSPNGAFHKVLMHQEVMTVRLEHDSADWVKINPGLFGFYRVHYPSDVLSKFLPSIESMELPPLDRLGLLDDAFALAQAGQSSTADVLKLLRSFLNEENYTVWANISKIITRLHSLLQYSNNEKVVKAFEIFARMIMSSISSKVGWEPKQGEGHLQALLRALVLDQMVSLKDDETLGEARRRFQLHNSGNTIFPDLRTVVYKGTLSDADEKTLDSFLQMYLATDNQEEQVRISRAFASIQTEELLQKVAEFAISPKVRKQDTAIIFCSIGKSKNGRDFFWEFFKSNWQLFHDNYPIQHISQMLKSTTQNFATSEKATEIESFFHAHPFRGTEMALKQAVEQIRLNESWLKADLGAIQAYFGVN